MPEKIIRPEREDTIATDQELRFLSETMHLPVRIYLVNGVKLDCHILFQDDVCVITNQKGSTSKKQLVYKSSISSIAVV